MSIQPADSETSIEKIVPVISKIALFITLVLGVLVGISSAFSAQIPLFSKLDVLKVPSLVSLGGYLISEVIYLKQRISKLLNYIESVEPLLRLPDRSRDPLRNLNDRVLALGESLKSNGNPGYTDFMAAEIKRSSDLLDRLSQARVRTSISESPHVHLDLVNSFHTRIDSVIYGFDKMMFWQTSPDARECLQQCVNSVTERETLISRIYIFTRQELKEKRDEIIEELQLRERQGLAWGVTVSDHFFNRVNTMLNESNMKRNFTLYDHDKAMSYFLEHGHTVDFHVEFSHNDKSDTTDSIHREIKLYEELLPECWLVNSLFYENYRKFLNQNDRHLLLLNDAKRYNSRLQGQFPNYEISLDTMFPFILKEKEYLKVQEEIAQKAQVSFEAAIRYNSHFDNSRSIARVIPADKGSPHVASAPQSNPDEDEQTKTAQVSS